MAVSEETKKQYIPTIGIETHVQLKTTTKLFAAVGNDAREAAPNTLISHICVGMPGALPVLNRKAVELASRAAFALKTEPQKFSKFDRKHYFYPDLPKGYQISQYDQPIILGGKVEIEVNGSRKTINITRVHLEEDAGKNTHPNGADYSLVDLNRAGTPLLEIVSEPEINSPAEAKAYVRELYLLMKYAGVSDADLYHGNMRFDVNVSVSKESGEFGTRSETKNLNSFRSVEAAVAYEIDRQIELLEKGEQVVQETRGWDEAKQKTTSQREKEEAHDYRYFPDPDLPPIVLTDEEIAAGKKALPKMPGQWRDQLRSLGLDQALIETLIDVEVEDNNAGFLNIIESVLDDPDKAKTFANWIVNILVPAYRDDEVNVKDDARRLQMLNAVYGLASEGKMHSNAARAMLIEMLRHDLLPDNIEKYAEEQGYIQVSDEGEIDKIVSEVISENQKAAEDVRKGEMKAIGFLVGQVMKKSAGKANPALAQQIIKKQLGI